MISQDSEKIQFDENKLAGYRKCLDILKGQKYDRSSVREIYGMTILHAHNKIELLRYRKNQWKTVFKIQHFLNYDRLRVLVNKSLRYFHSQPCLMVRTRRKSEKTIWLMDTVLIRKMASKFDRKYRIMVCFFKKVKPFRSRFLSFPWAL